MSDYLAQRLLEGKCDTVFSVAGSYATEFDDNLGVATAGHYMRQLIRVGNINEYEASYAAEGFAKARGGLGSICVSYGAGMLGTVNGITSAYVEGVPIVVINGSPTETDFSNYAENDVMSYHLVHGKRLANRDILNPVTCAQVVLGTPEQIPSQIDYAIQSALSMSRPVYIEVGRDKWLQSVASPVGHLAAGNTVVDDSNALKDATEMIFAGLQAAKRPLLYGGTELVRNKLSAQFQRLVDVSGFKFITDLSAKSVLSEFQPQFAGTYSAKMSDSATQQAVKEKDYVLQLGVWNAVLSTAGISIDQFLKGSNYAIARYNAVIGIDRKVYGSVSLKSLLESLIKKFETEQRLFPAQKWIITAPQPKKVVPSQLPSYDSFATILAQSTLLAKSVVCVDATFGFLASLSTRVHQNQWFNETIYAIIGWSSGGAVGVSLGLNKTKKVIVLIGDGGLMNCATGIATAARDKLDIVYCVFDNKVYAVDQLFADVLPFENPAIPFTGAHILPDWDWVMLAQAWGATGHLVTTNAELSNVLATLADVKGTHLVQIKVNPREVPNCVRWKLQSSKL